MVQGVLGCVVSLPRSVHDQTSTVRGRSGAVVLMRACRSEDSETVCALESFLPKLFSKINVSQWTILPAGLADLHAICPGLPGMSLDCTHGYDVGVCNFSQKNARTLYP